MKLARSEASIQGAVVAWARKNGIIAIKLSTNGRFGTSGWPDYMFLFSRHVAFIEFKRPGGKVTPRQLLRIKELELEQFDVMICDDATMGKDFLYNNLVMR